MIKSLNCLSEKGIQIKTNVRNFSTYCGGGRLKTVIYPKNLSEISYVYKILKDEKTDIIIVGNMSNILIKDKGYDGVVLSTKKLKTVSIADDCCVCGAGETLNQVFQKTAENNLSGLEALSTIPSTIGGAVYQNASCFGCHFNDLIDSVYLYDIDKAQTLIIDKVHLQSSYRNTALIQDRQLVSAVKLKLKAENKDKIWENKTEFLLTRNLHQPRKPSLGCVFKNPTDAISAGKLIEEQGFKGKRIGGAMVSFEHANFIINFDKGTANDYLALMEDIKDNTYKNFGIELHEEIRII